MLHPVDYLAVLLLLNGDVRHASCRRRAMPVLLVRREPDHVTRTDLLDRAAFALNPAAAGRDDQGLTERMRVPCRARARLECDEGAPDAGGYNGLIRAYKVSASALHQHHVEWDGSVGETVGFQRHRAGTEMFRLGSDLDVRLLFNLGQGRCTFYTCDLTYDYVRLNADYTT